MVGLPAAGKTTRAKELAADHAALRLSPDEWMIPLFGAPDPDGKRDVLEGRLIWLAMEALRLGTSVILDFGFWTREERTALRYLATQVGASCQVLYLPVDRDLQLARVNCRQSAAPEQTFPITAAELDGWREMFEIPDEAELSGNVLAHPPGDWPSWPEWAAARWPSSGVAIIRGWPSSGLAGHPAKRLLIRCHPSRSRVGAHGSLVGQGLQDLALNAGSP
jgi:predicted kinase